MQGVQAFEPKAKASIDLESFVAEDHFLNRFSYLPSERLGGLEDKGAIANQRFPACFQKTALLLSRRAAQATQVGWELQF